MLYPIKNREDSENLNELVSLNNQVDKIELQDKLGKRNFHGNKKNYLNHLVIQSKIPLNL